MKSFREILIEIKVERLKPQEIIGVLRKAKVQLAIEPKPKLRIPGRSGTTVRKVNAAVVAVHYQTWEGEKGKFDFKTHANKMERILQDAGYVVNRPYPDKTILAVVKEKR